MWPFFLELSEVKTFCSNHTTKSVHPLNKKMCFMAKILFTLVLMYCGVYEVQSSSCPAGCTCEFNGRILNCPPNGTFYLVQVPTPFPVHAVKIVLDNNDISVIKPNDFPKTRALLIFLSIQHNRINVIQEKAFQYLTQLQNLNLYNNQIGSPNINTFVGMIRLKLLHLGRNTILEIPCKAFKDLTQLENLKLGQNKITAINTCMFQDLTNLKQLDISNNRITHIEKQAFDGLTNLQDLSINNNYISKMHSEWFVGKGLVEVRMSGNPWYCNCHLWREYLQTKKLVTSSSCIHDNMCVRCHMPINLRTTAIDNVNASFWESCSSTDGQLEDSTLHCDSGNRNCTMKIATGAVSLNNSVPQTVMHLNLTTNPMSHINRSTFQGLGNLISLQLSTNNITTIEDHAFEDQSQLVIMDLSNNALYEIGEEIFFGLTSLENLNLKDNQISGAINNQTFHYLNSLSILDLGENDITEILECAFCNTTMQKLLLNQNSITHIHTRAFKGLSDLEILNIASNHLTQLDFAQFSGLTALVTINTSNNNWKCTCKMRIQLTEMIASVYKSVSCERDYFCMKCSSPSHLKGSFLHSVLQNNCTGNSTYTVTESTEHSTSGGPSISSFRQLTVFVIIFFSSILCF